jgi:hypothetical protein
MGKIFDILIKKSNNGIFFSETIYLNETKLNWNGLWITHFKKEKKRKRQPCTLSKMTTLLKMKKKIKL